MPETAPTRRTATETTAADAGSADAPLERLAWRAALLGAPFLVLHLDILARLLHFARTDGDWSHAFLVPLISGYFIHRQRDALAAAPQRPCWWGLAVMLAGLAGYLAGIAWMSDMLKGYAMVVELLGMGLLIAGPRAMRFLWFPIAYLIFAVKIDPAAWSWIVAHLEDGVASVAAALLGLAGIDARLIGATIELWTGGEPLTALNVAEACSGMRMLITLTALAAALAYAWDRPWGVRLLFALAAPPIALGVNVGRVVVIAALCLIDPGYAEGDFHVFVGLLMLVPALLILLALRAALAAWFPPVGPEPGEEGPSALNTAAP